ncbi:O-acetylhomoserine (thiol)-lyase [Sinorhizobium kostiense]|uniref:O-acetylhomoserine (Thiol)-lyase n=1 Tax=Sinorhizobium kostiense TaxID=76747 RepID=A0ABS4QZX5_9HYPH|nr:MULTISPECIES: PLP-dependent transferase [Sinorhizobium]MBP2236183.1 O-acetylhomoserine (thiol)-lyase [Sinorhizobium kostiense]
MLKKNDAQGHSVHPATASLHAGFRSDPTTKAVCVPIYQNTAYELDGDLSKIADIYNVKEDGYTYTRIINPTTRALETRFAAVDNAADCLAVASGQAATFIALANLCSGQPGDNIVAAPFLYGNTWNLLHNTFRRFGIETRTAANSEPAEFEKHVDDRTICLFGECVSNPILDPLPVRSLAEIGRKRGIPVVVDNTTTPLVCRPSNLGAAMATYSATKYICGHGTTLGGLISDYGSFPFQQYPDRFPLFSAPDEAHGGILWHQAVQEVNDLGKSAALLKARMTWLRDTGPCASPFNSFQLLQGLETLHLRMRQHCENAEIVADMLNNHPKVVRVTHPSHFTGRKRELADDLFDKRYGYGAMLMFEVKDAASGRALIENVEMIYHVSNVGDARTLITHPVSTTHTTVPREKRMAAGINDGTIRLCVGLEHADDIIRDLERALSAVN